MLYYKVKKEADNTYLYKSGITLIGSELFTKNEVVRKNIPLSCVYPVEVSQKDVWWSFGCRFC